MILVQSEFFKQKACCAFIKIIQENVHAFSFKNMRPKILFPLLAVF